MTKITKITIANFRAFYGKYEFDTEGKNLLIYGENGSGKSSLYAAIKDFFRSSEPSNSVVFEQNKYAHGKRHTFVGFNIDGSSRNYIFSAGTANTGTANANTIALFQEAALLDGWLTYRELLKTYLNADETNLYPILWNFWIKHMPSFISTDKIGEYWNREVLGAVL